MHGHFPYGMAVFSTFHIVVVVGGLYLLHSISKSLKRIANKIDKDDQL